MHIGLPGHRLNPQEAASWYMEACMTGIVYKLINHIFILWHSTYMYIRLMDTYVLFIFLHVHLYVY
jgi:hypothetical protein